MANVIDESKLMTAQQFLIAENLPAHCELVKGEIVEMNRPSEGHGEICAQIVFLLKSHCKEHHCGTIAGNDSGILTAKGPDTVRGADAAYYSFDRIAKGQMPDDYSGPSPEVVFEVLSKSDRWSSVLIKTGEYLGADVLVVCIVDPVQRTSRLFRPDMTDVMLTEDEMLELPEIKPTFKCKVSEIFE